MVTVQRSFPSGVARTAVCVCAVAALLLCGVEGAAPRHHRRSPMVDGIANLRNKVVDIDMDKVARLRRAIGANSTKYGGSMANVACGVFPPLNAIPSPMPASLAAALDNLEPELSSLFQEVGATAAAFTIVYDQSILRTYGFGSTRQPPSAGTNVTGDTVFRIGSVTKIFATMPMFQLRDAGKVSVETQVNSIRTDYTPKQHPKYSTARAASFADMASHMAGLPRDMPCDLFNCTASLDELVALVSNWTLINQPGSRPSYSNVGFTFIGRFLEAVSGQPWEEYIAANIFKPLGMDSTSTEPPADLSQLAMGYVNGVEQPLTPLGVNNPGGGLFSTGNDIAKFMSLMFRNEAAFGATPDQVLDGNTIREWLTRRSYSDAQTLQENTLFYEQFGMPWEVAHARLAPGTLPLNLTDFYLVSKDGAIDAYDSFLVMIPELKLGVYTAKASSAGDVEQYYLNTLITTAYAVAPLLVSALWDIAGDVNPPVPANINDFLGTYVMVTPEFTLTAVIGLSGTEIVLNVQGWYTDQPLEYIATDMMQMMHPHGTPCYYDETGTFTHVLAFTRGATGAVERLDVQGWSAPATPFVKQ